jgi:hypothetical protein
VRDAGVSRAEDVIGRPECQPPTQLSLRFCGQDQEGNILKVEVGSDEFNVEKPTGIAFAQVDHDDIGPATISGSLPVREAE